MKLDYETMNDILADIGMDLSPSESRMDYTPKMLAWREEAETRWKAHMAKNPDAQMDIRPDLPREDIEIHQEDIDALIRP